MNAPGAPTLAALAAWSLLSLPAWAAASAPVGSTPADAWRLCTAAADGAERLACFDEWANKQPWQAPAASAQALPEQPTVPVPAPIVATSAAPLTADPMP
ncbi:MAG: phospholipase, partial [Comamonas sp.]